MEVLRNDLHVGEHGHEVRVTRPAWHDVLVEMAGDRPAGDLPEVPADVEGVRGVDTAQDVERARRQHVDLRGLLGLELPQVTDVAERGDHEESTFPELSAEGKLFGFRHEGLWITVNTPKDLQRAEEHYVLHPELRPTLARGRS